MNKQLQINNLGESILEKFQYADSVRRKGGILGNRVLGELVTLTESFGICANDSGDRSLIEESESYSNIVEKLICENKCHKLYEHGFYNPFDGDDDESPAVVTVADVPEEGGVRIRGVRMWNSDTANKVMYINGKMIAGQRFEKGDIIERCPCRLLNLSDLYSNEIRKIAFPVTENKRVYAIPFGYGTYYRSTRDFDVSGNAGYRYDGKNPGSPCIVIFAREIIRKGDEITIDSGVERLGNEMKNDTFDYRKGKINYKSVKSFSFV